MIREIIKPKDTHLIINIPKEYIGQEVEYIIFPLHKVSKDKKVEKEDKIDSLGGILNKYANPSKMELEDKAWEFHIMDKFTK